MYLIFHKTKQHSIATIQNPLATTYSTIDNLVYASKHLTLRLLLPIISQSNVKSTMWAQLGLLQLDKTKASIVLNPSSLAIWSVWYCNYSLVCCYAACDNSSF